MGTLVTARTLRFELNGVGGIPIAPPAPPGSVEMSTGEGRAFRS
jgi:hypothetical protein